MKFLCILVSIILVFRTYAQFNVNNVHVQSPNVASLGMYGQIEVSHYTGVPNISLPLYEVSEKGLSLPMSLSYHPASIKAEMHPGWVGLGWSLSSGGVVSRTVNGFHDEFSGSCANYAIKEHKRGYFFNNTELNVDGWDGIDQIKQYVDEQSYEDNDFNNYYDHEPDLFSFTFLNYTGTFCYGHDSKFHVVSDVDIKVEIDFENDLREWHELRSPIKDVFDCYSGSMSECSKYLSKIKLVTPEGYVGVFGNDPDAIEYSISYGNQIHDFLLAQAWHLTEIITPQKDVVKYTYTSGNPVVSLGRSYTYTTSTLYCDNNANNCSKKDGICGLLNSAVSPVKFGKIILPAYLNAISTKNSRVEFAISNTVESRYGIDALMYNHMIYSYSHRFTRTGMTPIDNHKTDKILNNIQWNKLDSIRIYDKVNSKYVKQINFYYTDKGTERLKLLKVQEYGMNSGKKSISNRPYNFFYNEKKLPTYEAAPNNIDHWGYFNGRAFENHQIGVYNAREPDPTIACNGDSISSDCAGRELLERIVYPTGGDSRFVWEPHQYGKYVRDLKFIEHKNGFTGGVRIRKIITSTGRSGDLPLQSEFYYTDSYQYGVDNQVCNLNSSGILASQAKYFWNWQGRDRANNNVMKITLNNGNSLAPLTLNANGSYIGYSQVVEVHADGSFSKFYYSNFDTDIHGADHFDERGTTIDEGHVVLDPISSKSLERGKLLQILHYSSSGSKVRQLTYTFTKQSDDCARTLRVGGISICKDVSPFGTAFYGTANKLFTYKYLKTKEEIKDFHPQGEKLLTTRMTDYEYNESGFVTLQKTKNSSGVRISLRKKYVSDLSVDSLSLISSCAAMVDMRVEIPGVYSLYQQNGIDKYWAYTMQALCNNDFHCTGTCVDGKPHHSWVAHCDAYDQGLRAYNNHVDLTNNRINTYKQCLEQGHGVYLGMKAANIISPAIETLTTVSSGGDEAVIEGVVIKYNEITGGVFAPVSSQQLEMNSPKRLSEFSQAHLNKDNWELNCDLNYKDRATYQYDENGNVRQIKRIDGAVIVYLWSYNSTLPVAVIEGLTFDELRALPGNTEGTFTSIATETNNEVLKTKLNALRSMVTNARKPALMTSYLYEPLKGITQMIDSNGIETSYEYDYLGRLDKIRNTDQHLLKQIDYHYQAQ